jgi:hypothetical protein
VDGVQRQIQNRYGNQVTARTSFVSLSEGGSGLAAEVPWILHGTKSLRKGRQAGDPITYPALVLQLRG